MSNGCKATPVTLPSFFVIQAQVSALRERASLIDRTIVIRKKDVSLEDIEKTKLLIEKLKENDRKPRLGNLLLDIKKSISSGIRVTNFRYSVYTGEEKTEGENKLAIRGIASDRNTLISFSENLKDIKEVSSSNLPISQLAKSINIPFLIEIKGSF